MKGYIYLRSNAIESEEIYFVYTNFIRISKVIRESRKEFNIYEVEFKPDPSYYRLENCINPTHGKFITITKKLYENKKERRKRSETSNFTLDGSWEVLENLTVGSSD